MSQLEGSGKTPIRYLKIENHYNNLFGILVKSEFFYFFLRTSKYFLCPSSILLIFLKTRPDKMNIVSPSSIDASSAACNQPSDPKNCWRIGAGEGNRTLILSLGS